MLCEIVCLIIGLFGLYQLQQYVRASRVASTLPKLSKADPIIGHLRRLKRSPVDFFAEIRTWMVEEKFPLFLVHTCGFMGVVIRGPEEIEKIISTIKNHKKSEVYKFLHGWLDQGLLTSQGKKWQTRRKILTPAFHFNILQHFISIFNDETELLLDQLKDLSADGNPVVLDVVPLITDLTLLTINETSMGVKLDLATKEGYRYKQDVYEISKSVVDRFVRPWHYFNGIYYNFTIAGRYNRKITNSLHTFTEKVIKEREKDFKEFDIPSDETEQYSFRTSKRKKLALLDLLLNAKLKDGIVDDKGIMEEVNTFMFEGHDTTAMNISYTLMLLANHPEKQEKVYQELLEVVGHDLTDQPTYAQLQELQYTERCIKESLRLYPSVPFIGRTSEEDIETKHGTIPKGLPLFLMIYDLHRDPKWWPDPEKFNPERFTLENSIGRHPYSYIPFSAGPRNCIGQRFAFLEAKSVLCGILRNFRLEPVDTPKTLVLIQDLILRSTKGIKVKFVPRK